MSSTQNCFHKNTFCFTCFSHFRIIIL